MRDRTRTRGLRSSGIVLALCVAIAACSSQPGPEVLRPSTSAKAILIQDVAVLDVEKGRRTLGRDVLIEDGKITSIVKSGSVPPHPDADLISGQDATLVPGLIDMHGHIVAGTAPSWESGFPDPEGNLRAYLYAGVTTVFDPGDSSGDAFERRDEVARGALLGPRIFTAGPLLTCPGGHPIAIVEELAPAWIRWFLVSRVAETVADEAQAIEIVDRLSSEGADAIKVAVDQIPLGAPRISNELVAALVKRARRHKLRVVAHVGTTQDAVDAAEAGVSLWMHGIYSERIPDDQIPVLAAFGIPMVATLEVFDRYARAGDGPWVATRLESETVPASRLDSFYPIPDDFDLGSLEGWLERVREHRETQRENLRRLHRAGVTVLAGSDTQSGVFPGAGLHRELGLLVNAGLTPAQAIRAATLDPARFLTRKEDPAFGQIAEGKLADLVLVEGDPLEDISVLEDIREVILGGVPLERQAIPRPDPGS